MEIKLLKLSLKNFKGLKQFTFEPGGNNATIYGDNAKGKTTIHDAFWWVLFDKDSTGSSKFEIKPLDDDGKEIHHLQTEVEITLLVDNKTLQLKKMQEEKWSTPRGQSEQVFGGNETSYWWNEIPVKKGEYDKNINELVSESTFMALTNPLYFNQILEWKKRRQVLIDLSGADISDHVILASDSKFEALREALGDNDTKDFKTILNERIKGLKKEKDNILPRIDELTSRLPVDEIDYEGLKKEVEQKQAILSDLENQLYKASEPAKVHRTMQSELNSLEIDITELKQSIVDNANSSFVEYEKQKTHLMLEVMKIDNSLENRLAKIEICEQQIKDIEAQLEASREDWKRKKDEQQEIIKQEFTQPDEDFNCKACGQKLPDGDRETLLQEMIRGFEDGKAKRLAIATNALTDSELGGKRLKEQLEQIITDKETFEQTLKQFRFDKELTLDKLKELETSKPEKVDEIDFSQNSEYIKLEKKIQALKDELTKPVEDTTSELLAEKENIEKDIRQLNRIIDEGDRAEKDKARIEELRVEEKEISTKIAEYEGHKFMIDQVEVARVNLIEGRINSKFEYITYKMFKENISNDGIQEVCEALVDTNGAKVPFTSANTAGKINAGIDSINALSEFYGVVAPIFIDNSESVTSFIPTNAQIIRLVKPLVKTDEDKKKYSQLVVEVE